MCTVDISNTVNPSLTSSQGDKIEMLKEIARTILNHTVVTRSHLTPELALRLVTPTCPLWRATEAELPFKDPFWAFYWPGGQATARFILDNGHFIAKNKKVLDIGCGCGAAAIAAAKYDAKYILANDIDLYATTATEINADLNGVHLHTTTENLIGSQCEAFDTIIVGDMFYDEEFASMLFEWLRHLTAAGKTVLIGDPGRHGLTNKRMENLTLIAKYQLSKECCIENNGFTEATVWKIR
ncbi:hypothetical protein ACJJTC_004245 [Scirpophaga incertulas]